MATSEYVVPERPGAVAGGRPWLRSFTQIGVSWGAIFAGAVASLAIWLLLYSLGMALGLSAIDPGDAGSLKFSGVFTGVWSLISPLIALFVGGMVATIGSASITKPGAAIHALVMWGMTTLFGAWLLVNLLSAAFGGALNLGRVAAETGAAGPAAIGAMRREFDLDERAAIAPINLRLRAQGTAEVSAVQIEIATKEALEEASRTGRLDRAELARALATRTTLSRADADQVATRIAAQFDEHNRAMGARREEIKTGVLSAAEGSAAAFWGIFGSLLLGLASAIGGALVVVSRRQRLVARELPPAVVMPPRRPEPPLTTPPREVYP
jgi:hypothetical protein